MKTAAKARARRWAAYQRNRAAFVARLLAEIDRFVAACVKAGVRACVRLNGTSDLEWADVIAARPGVRFYDYTKSPARMHAFLAGELPANYFLVFSRGGVADHAIPGVLRAGGNVSVVFSTKRGEPLPETHEGVRVVDGDAHDLCFLDDGRGVIRGLRAKGRARDTEAMRATRSEGFVVQV